MFSLTNIFETFPEILATVVQLLTHQIDKDYFLSRKDDILFIGNQKKLDSDFIKLNDVFLTLRSLLK